MRRKHNKMLKIKKLNIEKIVLIVVFLPVFLLLMLLLLISIPIDYVRYKRSRYFKDTKEKYFPLGYASYYVRFYDLIKKHGLPIDYYRCESVRINGYGFFIYGDTLILNDYEPIYDEEKGTWTVEIEDEYVDIKDEAEDRIKRCNEEMDSNICKKAILLIEEELYNEHPDVKYENIEILPVKDKYDDVESIRKIIVG